jgi:hypothetical protein
MHGQIILRQTTFCSAAELFVGITQDRKKLRGRGWIQREILMEGEEGWGNKGRIRAHKDLE